VNSFTLFVRPVISVPRHHSEMTGHFLCEDVYLAIPFRFLNRLAFFSPPDFSFQSGSIFPNFIKAGFFATHFVSPWPFFPFIFSSYPICSFFVSNSIGLPASPCIECQSLMTPFVPYTLSQAIRKAAFHWPFAYRLWSSMPPSSQVVLGSPLVPSLSEILPFCLLSWSVLVNPISFRAFRGVPPLYPFLPEFPVAFASCVVLALPSTLFPCFPYSSPNWNSPSFLCASLLVRKLASAIPLLFLRLQERFPPPPFDSSASPFSFSPDY